MKRISKDFYGLLIIMVLSLAILVGCGGGGSSSSSPTTSTSTENPYKGTLSGTWSYPASGTCSASSGTLSMTIDANGNFSGSAYDTVAGTTVSLSGIVSNDGNLTATLSNGDPMSGTITKSGSSLSASGTGGSCPGGTWTGSGTAG